MSFSIRGPRPDDYEVLTKIHNEQNEPDHFTTAGRLARADDRRRESDPHFRRLVLEEDGEILATGTLHSDFGRLALPSRRWVYLHTRADRRGEGLDRLLLDDALHSLGRAVAEVLTCVRTDFKAMTDFIAADGFEERYRSWGSHLDLTGFDGSRFDPVRKRLERTGYRFVRMGELLPELPDRDAFIDRLIALQRELEGDADTFEPIIPERNDDPRSEHALPDACVLALLRDEVVGMASLVGPGRGETIECGFTGVAREHRNRGLATVLESTVAGLARGMGFADLNAGGGGTDTPMLSVKRKLGYVVEPAWITYSRSLG